MLEMMNELKAKVEKDTLELEVSRNLRDDFEQEFGHQFNNWVIRWPSFEDERETHYLTFSKTETKFEVRGLSRWATMRLMSGYPVFTEFRGVEQFFKDNNLPWICMIELNDELIIVSNFKTRSGLIEGA